MTVVACWIDEKHPKYPGVWCAADGRLSGSGVLADLAPKVFRLPVACVEFREQENGLVPYFRQEVGLAILGHGLVAYQTCASAALVCGQLTHPDTFKSEKPVPSLAAIATLVGEVMRQHMLDWRPNWPSGLCSALVFGFCAASNRHVVYHLKVESEAPLTVGAKEHEPPLADPLLLGSGAAALHELLGTTSPDVRLPLPLLALERMVRGNAKDSVESVGGSPLLGVAGRQGFRHFRIGQRIEGMPKEAETHEEVQLWDCRPEGFLYRVQALG